MDKKDYFEPIIEVIDIDDIIICSEPTIDVEGFFK